MSKYIIGFFVALAILVVLVLSFRLADAQVGIGGRASSGGVAQASAPTLTEGSFTSFFFDLLGNLRVTLGTLISGEDQTNNLMQTSGGVVRTTTVASAITTNTTSAAATVPIGSKTFAAVLTGTGAIVQTLAIYGSVDNTYTVGVDPLICTITLSGTTAVGDACAVVTANFAYYFVVSTATSGTSASGVVYAMY